MADRVGVDGGEGGNSTPRRRPAAASGSGKDKGKGKAKAKGTAGGVGQTSAMPTPRQTPPSKAKTTARPGRPPARTPPGDFTPAFYASDPPICPYCRTSNATTSTASSSSSTSSMLCAPCVRHRIGRYVDHFVKLRDDSQLARERVEALLGSSGGVGHGHGDHLDPFGPPSDLPRNPHPTASHAGRTTRAQWSQLTTSIGTLRGQVITSEHKCDDLRRNVAEKRAELQARRARLAKACKTISRDWRESTRSSDAGWQRRELERHVQKVRLQNRSVHEALQRVRMAKLNGIVEYVGIGRAGGVTVASPPPAASSRFLAGSFPAAFSAAHPRAHTATPTLPSPAPHQQRLDPRHDWTIQSQLATPLSVPLPATSDLTRFPREDTNAAVALTARVVALLADVVGVALPFSVGLSQQQGGKWACRVDPLFVGVDEKVVSRTREYTLHLGKSAYAGLVAEKTAATGASSSSASNSTSTPAAAAAAGSTSTFLTDASIISLGSLGMSTITNTLESFVHLPGGGRSHANDAVRPSTAASPSSLPSSSSGAATAAQDFRMALTMLSYDVAYLYWTQGNGSGNGATTATTTTTPPPSSSSSMDLVKAGGSILALIHEICTTSREAGGANSDAAASSHPRSHIGLLPPGMTLSDFSFPPVEFGKLLQLHGIAGGGGEAKCGGGAAAAAAAAAAATTSKAKAKDKSTSQEKGAGTVKQPLRRQQPAMASRNSQQQQQQQPVAATSGMDESYIDAGRDAASVIFRDRATTTATATKTKTTIAQGNTTRPTASVPARQDAPASTTTATTTANSHIPHHPSPLSNAQQAPRQRPSAVAAAAKPTTLELLRKRGQKARQGSQREGVEDGGGGSGGGDGVGLPRRGGQGDEDGQDATKTKSTAAAPMTSTSSPRQQTASPAKASTSSPSTTSPSVSRRTMPNASGSVSTTTTTPTPTPTRPTPTLTTTPATATTTTHSPRPGTVIFNGKEIRSHAGSRAGFETESGGESGEEWEAL